MQGKKPWTKWSEKKDKSIWSTLSAGALAVILSEPEPLSVLAHRNVNYGCEQMQIVLKRFAAWTESGDRELIESDEERQGISEWNGSGVALGSWGAEAVLGLGLRLAAVNGPKATWMLKERVKDSQQHGEVFVGHWCLSVSEGFHNKMWQYCLLRIMSCCIGLLTRVGKVRPGGAEQEKPLPFGGAEQPCEQRLKGRALSLRVNGVFVMYCKCS